VRRWSGEIVEARRLLRISVMPARNTKPPTNQRDIPSEARPQRRRAAKQAAPGEGLDRSTEALIETTRNRMKPAPPDALPDRHTTDSTRRR
jgi:hypothetical protein